MRIFLAGILDTAIASVQDSEAAQRLTTSFLLATLCVLAVAVVLLGAVEIRRRSGRTNFSRQLSLARVAFRLRRFILSGLVPAELAAVVALTALATLPLGGGRLPVGQLAGMVVLSGVAAMVLIETVKRLLPLRGAYHRRQVALWLQDRSADEPAGLKAMGQLVRAMDLTPGEENILPPHVEPTHRRKEPSDEEELRRARLWQMRRKDDLNNGIRWRRFSLIGPGVGGVFNLPAEQLAAQIGAAADQASRDITEYCCLISALCPSLPHEELRKLDPRATRDDRERREGTAEVASHTASAIDQLQIHLAGRWRHYLQVTAWWLAGLVALALAFAGQSPFHSATFVLAALVFGGFFAWLARDASAAIERLRR